MSMLKNNWSMRFLTLILTSVLYVNMAQAAQGELINTQVVEVGSKVTLHSEALLQQRNISVSLPDGYYNSDEKYPVIYILDGDAFFKPLSALTHSLALSYSMKSSIVVAISQKNRHLELAGPSKEKFSQFIYTEIIPYVEQKYRTSAHRTLIGHSLGGSFTLKSMISSPEMFQAYVAISPVLNRDNVPSTDEIRRFLVQHKELNKFLYLAKGSELSSYQTTILELKGILSEHAPKGFKWSYKMFAEDNHSTVPIPAFYYALKTLYKGFIMPEVSDLTSFNNVEKLESIGGVEAIKKYYEQYSNGLGYHVDIPEIVFSRVVLMLFNDNQDAKLKSLIETEGRGKSTVLYYLGYRYLNNSQHQQALDVFKLNVSFHPLVAQNWHSLAESYQLSGEYLLAEESFLKALSLAKDYNDPQFYDYQKSYDDFIKKSNHD